MKHEFEAIANRIYTDIGKDPFGRAIPLKADISASGMYSNESVDYTVAGDDADKWIGKKVRVTIETID